MSDRSERSELMHIAQERVLANRDSPDDMGFFINDENPTSKGINRKGRNPEEISGLSFRINGADYPVIMRDGTAYILSGQEKVCLGSTREEFLKNIREFKRRFVFGKERGESYA